MSKSSKQLRRWFAALPAAKAAKLGLAGEHKIAKKTVGKRFR